MQIDLLIDQTSEMFKHKHGIASVLITTYGLKKTNIQAGSRKYLLWKTCSGRLKSADCPPFTYKSPEVFICIQDCRNIFVS